MHRTDFRNRRSAAEIFDGGVFLKKTNNSKLRIIPLGGLEAIGMNITAFEYGDR